MDPKYNSQNRLEMGRMRYARQPLSVSSPRVLVRVLGLGMGLFPCLEYALEQCAFASERHSERSRKDHKVRLVLSQMPLGIRIALQVTWINREPIGTKEEYRDILQTT